MKEKGLQSRACAASVAAVAGLGMAGMGLVSDGIVAADTTSVTDTISVTVQPSCTFKSVEDKTYTGSAANGTEVNNFNDSGVHEFNLFCNDNNGFIVTATPYDLEADGIDDVISYTDNYTHTGVDSMWTAEIASDAAGVTVTSPAPVGGGTIISSGSSTSAAGVDFTATYKAYVGSATPAGTYTGTIVYTLTASGTSNSGNGDSGTGSGSEETGNNEEGGGSGGSGSGGSGSGSENPDASSNEPAATPGSTPLATPLNNTYATYNTYSTNNTYNTTNYSGSGTGTPVATSGNTSDTTNDTTGGDSESSSSTNNGYEQPLGVTTSTSSSSKESSDVDLMPIIVAGTVAVVGGAAAIALARSNKDEE